MMKTGNEINNNKTKVPDEFLFRIISLVCFTAELENKLIQNQCTLACVAGGISRASAFVLVAKP